MHLRSSATDITWDEGTVLPIGACSPACGALLLTAALLVLALRTRAARARVR